MQYSFQHSSHNEGSLRIYQPPPTQDISHNIFKTDHPSFPNPNTNPNAYSKNPSSSYHRQQSLIDELSNKQQQASNEEINSLNEIHPKPTSIEFLVEQNDNRQNRLKKMMQNKIEDIFANKPALSSKEINSSMFLKSINDPLFQAKTTNSNQILLASFPSKEYISDSPQRPNLSRPFLRKKTTSKSSQGEQSQAFSPTYKKDEQTSFQLNKIQMSIKTLKEYNQDLTIAYKSLQAFRKEGKEGWRSLRKRQLQVVKLMIEKAIIGKEQYH